MKNISNIDMEQNLFERIIGTYKIKIDTNSSALADKTDIKIVFSKKKAIEFKKLVISYMSQSDSNVIPQEREEVFDVRYTVKDVLWNCFYTTNIFTILFLMGLVLLILFYVFIEKDNNLNGTLQEIFGGLIAIMIGFGSAVYPIVKNFMKLYDFRVRREPEKIYIKHALFLQNANTIPISKINGIILTQPLFSKIFQKYQVEIINIRTGDEEGENSNLLLSCSKEEVKKHISILLPEFEEFVEQPLKRQSPKYFLHAAVGILCELILAVVVVIIMNHMNSNFLQITIYAIAVILLISILGYNGNG